VIDFRYHLVSIVAVFLALGLGIVLGSTALRPSVLSGLERTSQQERHQISSVIATNGQQRRELASNDQFAQAAAPLLLRQLLTGERVVLVEAPGAPSQAVIGITRALTEAGASISGQLQLQNKFFDPSPTTQEQLGQLAQQFTPPGQALGDGTVTGQASQVLAGAILTRDGPGQPVAGQPDSASLTLLSGFAAAGFLTTPGGHPDARATLAVVVAPGNPPSVSDSNAASQALVTFAQWLNRAGQGTVVAGTVEGSGPGSAIDVMRTGGRAGHMSSVDNADQTIGQITVAQALAGLLRGVSGSYGATSSAEAAGPSPLPTPSSTPPSSLGAAATRRPARATPGAAVAGKS
jgi:Copper transport outer membrane protein, MctB